MFYKSDRVSAIKHVLFWIGVKALVQFFLT